MCLNRANVLSLILSLTDAFSTSQVVLEEVFPTDPPPAPHSGPTAARIPTAGLQRGVWPEGSARTQGKEHRGALTQLGDRGPWRRREEERRGERRREEERGGERRREEE